MFLVVRLLSNSKSGFDSSCTFFYVEPLRNSNEKRTIQSWRLECYILLRIQLPSYTRRDIAEILLGVKHYSINQSIVNLSFPLKIKPANYTHTSHDWHVILLYIFMYETHVLLFDFTSNLWCSVVTLDDGL